VLPDIVAQVYSCNYAYDQTDKLPQILLILSIENLFVFYRERESAKSATKIFTNLISGFLEQGFFSGFQNNNF